MAKPFKKQQNLKKFRKINHNDPAVKARYLINYRLKEKIITDEIIEYLKEYNIEPIINKTVSGGSSRYRPDILINKETYNIIVEIDEHQHRRYKKNTQRNKQLYKDLNELPLIIIRFNPDKYITNRKTKKSVFGKDRLTRIYHVTCPHQYKIRMNILKSKIEECLKNKPETNNIIEHKLFFNGYKL